jgi:hypothetical protein
MERDSTCPRTDVEDAATRIAQAGSVVRRPAAKGSEVERGPKRLVAMNPSSRSTISATGWLSRLASSIAP